MDTSKIGVRYARALFGVAQDKKLVDQVREDLDLISLSFREIPDLPAALNNPVVQPSKKALLLEQIFKAQVQPLTLSFLRMLVENRRESYLQDVVRHYLHLFMESKQLKPARLVTARTINEQTRHEMLDLIRKYFRTEVELVHEVKENIIGGFVLTVDDRQLDASVASGLKRIRQELSKKIR